MFVWIIISYDSQPVECVINLWFVARFHMQINSDRFEIFISNIKRSVHMHAYYLLFFASDKQINDAFCYYAIAKVKMSSSLFCSSVQQILSKNGAQRKSKSLTHSLNPNANNVWVRRTGMQMRIKFDLVDHITVKCHRLFGIFAAKWFSIFVCARSSIT